MDMTKQALAELTGMTYRQIFNINKKLVQEDESKALFVKGEDAKKCDLAIFVQRWVDYNVERVSASTDDLDAVKAAHESVKMRKTQLEVDRMEGSLVDVQEVRKIWGDIANTIMQSMIHLPSTLAPMVRGMDNVEVINNVIDTEIRKVLEGLSDTPLPAYLLLQDEDDEEAEEE
ncbi:MAG: hypothetical protein IJM56_05060 [Clostridia bacterium]|nr:hypothetical protein [Clostridia bacterium]